MSHREVIYRQLNKDYAYWTEKRRVGQQTGGQLSALLSYIEDGQVRQNVLFDAGLGALEAIADFCDDAFWDQPLTVFITHGHIDHHAELMILSEIYCLRRGDDIHDVRPPLPIYATEETQFHLARTHWYGYNDGDTLQYAPLRFCQPVSLGPFRITPLPVDHFEGAVIYTVTFELSRAHKILIGWDMTTLPTGPEQIQPLRRPSLALLEATTWTDMARDVGHTSVQALVESGFLQALDLTYDPPAQQHGAYLVHYSGWEDPGGMLSDAALKKKFDATYPRLAPLVRLAQRGQTWRFT
ncbi:MAG TPA: MBL fold metallo-hydrolase [Candidatus Sulfomarinibacteraceae bacterium]|nr:MBL fold metallo-hydrolase [Candidatus Sulfomarinibacteraceae bacterium]